MSDAFKNKLYSLIIELEGLPRSNNGGCKGWKTKHYDAQRWKQDVAWSCLGKKPKEPLPKANIICTRYSSREPDYDNLVTSFKPLVDGLKLGKVITDDKMSVIGIPKYEWEKSNQGRVKIEVYQPTEIIKK